MVPAPDRRLPLIGVCGLSPFEHGEGVELLYSLTPSHRTQGLATEAATAVLAYAFDTLALPEVIATTDDDNTPSLRLLTRLNATPAPRLQGVPAPTPASPSAPGMLVPGPCSSMDRATDF